MLCIVRNPRHKEHERFTQCGLDVSPPYAGMRRRPNIDPTLCERLTFAVDLGHEVKCVLTLSTLMSTTVNIIFY